MEKLSIRLDDLAQYIATEIRKEQNESQGHKLTGKLAASTKGSTRDIPDGAIIEVVREQYGEFLDNGVSRNRVPFSPGSGAKTSKYIEGLIRFVKLRGLKPRGKQTHKDIAFAIARKHKRVGIPTPASKRFSKTGRRTGALGEVVEREKTYIRDQIRASALEYIEAMVADMLTAILTSSFSSTYQVTDS